MTGTQLTFIHISDTHISDNPDYNVPDAVHKPVKSAKALVQTIQNLPFDYDFVLHTGDVVYDPHESAYDTARDIFSPIRKPVFYIAGNHDHQAGLQTRLVGSKQSIANYHYEFETNGVQVICVDSNGPAEPPAGNMTDEQMTWLEALCKADDDRPLIVAVHHNPVPVGVPWLDGWMRITNGLDFHEVVKQAKHRLVGVFHGHIHQATTVYREGVMYCACASSWYQLGGYPGMEKPAADTSAKSGFSVVTVQDYQAYVRRYWFDVS